jgi:membrane protease YdiL (CAAX protease family)
MNGTWARLPVVVRAVVTGLLMALVAANVWPLLLLNLGTPVAAIAEVVFLVTYLWWASGSGPPARWRHARASVFRATRLTARQWAWGLTAAVFFAGTVHAAIVVLFRMVPFPAAAFHAGYDFSFIPSDWERGLAVVISAASAGVCEETGFRGYMQRPIEDRHGVALGILVASTLFMLIHLSKDWSTLGMVPIVFGAGMLLGAMAYASQSLIPSMIGHTIMDIGLFGYWWTGIWGTFPQRPISETGVTLSFGIELAMFVAALAVTLLAIGKLWRTSSSG